MGNVTAKSCFLRPSVIYAALLQRADGFPVKESMFVVLKPSRVATNVHPASSSSLSCNIRIQSMQIP